MRNRIIRTSSQGRLLRLAGFERERFRCGVVMALAFALALMPGVARADLYGGDLPLLTAIVANGADEISQLSQSIAQAKKTYDETRRLAGYADDAVKAFNSVKSLNGAMFGQSVVNGLDLAFPEVAQIQNDVAQHNGLSTWGQGTGELGMLVTGCARYGPGGFSCGQLQRAVTAEDARKTISATFGTAPATSPRATAMDSDAAVGLAASSSQVGRNQVTRAQMAALLEQCSGGTDSDSIAACQAAANAAQIQGVQTQSYLSDQAALQTRLQADHLAQANAEHKDSLARQEAERQLLLEGSDKGALRPVSVKTEGIDILGGAP